MRYEQLWNWVTDHKPKVILEIGTYDGKNGARMMKLSGADKYIGFDIWEDGTEELDKIEFNVKKHGGTVSVQGSVVSDEGKMEWQQRL